MGKTKGSKVNRGTTLDNPTGLISVKQADKEKELTSDELQGIETVIEKLKSSDADEREYGCVALAIYISNPTTLNEVLRKKVVRLVSPLLQDQKPAVQLAASDLLREMSEEGGFEACEQMIRQDIFTGLAAFLRNVIGSWKQSAEDVKVDDRLQSFTNSLYTVQNLCECSALAVRLSLEDSIPAVLLASLDAHRFPSSVLLAAAQCLYTISEENETVAELLRQAESQRVLTSLMSSDKVLLYTRVIIAGVQFNTYDMEVMGMNSDGVVSLLLLALQADSYQSMNSAMSLCIDSESSTANISKHMSDVDMSEESEEKDNKKSKHAKHDSRKELKDLDNLISAQKLGFELLTNILGDDDTDDWADMEADDDSVGTSESNEHMEDEEMDMYSENPTAAALADKGLVKLIGDRLQFITVELYQAVDKSGIHRQALQSTLRGYDSMLASALLCFNNAVSQLKLDRFGGCEAIRSMVKHLLDALSVSHVSSQESLVESITSALRSATEQLAHKSESITFDDQELNTLQRLTCVPHTGTAANAIKCVAAVGISLSKQPTPNPTVKAIGSMLMQVLSSDKLWLQAEALDSIMDVFAEDSNNIYLKELGVISTLQTIVPELKSLIAKRDKTDHNILPVLSTIRSNLPRFIKYKNKLL